MKSLVVILSALCLICSCGGGGGGGGSSAPSGPPPVTVSLAPATQMTIDQGQSLNFTVTLTNDTNNQGVTWSASGAGAAFGGSGCTGSACGTFTNATKTAATYVAPAPLSSNLTVTVTATSVANPAATASTTVVATPLPSILTTTLPHGTPNQPYSATLQGSGGAGTLGWSLASGSLTAGLQLNSAGQIYGTPTSSGTATFTVKLSDSSQSSAGAASVEQQLSLTVVGVLTVTTASLPNGTVGVAYGASIQANGGTPPYVWNLYTGALPPGLVLQPTNSNVVSVTGTPTTAGSPFYFTVEVLDSGSPQQTATQPLEITINPAGPLTITTTALLDGTVDVPYTAKIVATGGTPPISWSVTSGALPTGLNWNPGTGTISGTPTSAGTFDFSVTATDATGLNQTQPLAITINAALAACNSTGNNGVLSGQYAFSLSGFNATGFLGVVGSFTADGQGHITAGEADTNGVLGAQSGNLISAASAYSVGADNRGCATLAMPFGTFITRFALSVTPPSTATSGQMIEFDSPNPNAYIATGQILPQNPTAFQSLLTGTFVFRMTGWDSSAGGGRDVCVGVVEALNNNLSDLDEECNDNFTSSNPTGGTGTYTSFDTNGRATATVLVGTGTSHWTLYLVSSTQFLTVNSDLTPASTGFAQQQTPPTGGFNAGSQWPIKIPR